MFKLVDAALEDEVATCRACGPNVDVVLAALDDEWYCGNALSLGQEPQLDSRRTG